jgi:RimJ/RimL family protein N-acetyltransferase
MKPVELRTRRLTLDQPTRADRDLIVEYCRDPLFERFMLTPWPYQPEHADTFVDRYVPEGWRTDREFTWALRRDGVFLGVVGFREAAHDIGFWLGAPYRGNGYMPEAVTTVLDWAFDVRGADSVVWECMEGNVASMTVARKTGFAFTGAGPSLIPARDGSHPAAWHGRLHAEDDRAPKSGWPV